MINEENEELSARIDALYFSLLISVPIMTRARPMLLTGANQNGEPNVQQQSDYDMIYCVLGSRWHNITLSNIENSAVIVDAMARIRKQGEFNRVWRVLHAFYAATRSNKLGLRLHQFVRCIEGFILPRKSSTEKQFVSRTELFIGPRHHPLMHILYQIRSAVEHLHGPFKAISGKSKRERHIELLRYTIQAEAIARHCLNRLFFNRSLWKYFEDDSMLEKFWALSSQERQSLWGEPIDIQSALRGFKPEWYTF